MGWLNKLFSKKIEEKEIHIDSLLDWLNSETKSIYESFESKANEHISKMRGLFKKLEEQVHVLGNAEIKNADKIQSKVKSVVLGHKGNYARMLNQLINTIKIPVNMGHDSILEFAAKTENNLNNFTKNSTKSYYASQHLFHKEIEEIAKTINEFDNILKNIRKLAEKANIIQINKLKEKIAGLNGAINKKEELGLQLEENKKKLQESELSKQLAEKKIEELEQSREFQSLHSLKTELNGVKNDVLQLETKIIQLFSPLERALKKFSRITLKDEKLVENYASSPAKALLSDTELKIMGLLQNMKKNILSNSIELKDKQREKTLEIIDGLTKEQLAGLVYKYSALQEKKESFKKQIKANKATNTKKELEYKLEHARLMFNRIKNRISEIEKNREKIDLTQLKKDLETNLNYLLRQEIKIKIN